MVQRHSQPDDVLPIVKLVREKVDASEWSLRTYAQMRGVAYSTLRRYYDKNLSPLRQPPRRETLRELALALDVPLGEVEQAALESLSYRSSPVKLEPRATNNQSRPAGDIIAAIEQNDELLPEAKEHLINQVGLLLRVQRAAPVGLPHRGGRTVSAVEAAEDERDQTALDKLSVVPDSLPSSPRPSRPSRK